VIVNEQLSPAVTSAVGVNTMTWNELQTNPASNHGQHLPPLPATKDLGVTVDDPMMIFFSSGTTGPQKAVMLSHRNIHAQFLISWSVFVLYMLCSRLVFLFCE